MSILFQLFRAQDLAALTPDQFERLKNDIQGAMSISPDASLRLAVGSNLQTHWEDARRELMLSSPRIDRVELETALRNRARVVFQQLMDHPPASLMTPPPEPPGGNLIAENEDLLGQLLSASELSELRQNALKEEIFIIAISCELSYFNSYRFLESIKDRANSLFREFLPEQLPMGPDSSYRLWR